MSYLNHQHYREIIEKWICALNENRLVHYISYWTELQYLEDVLIEMKKQLQEFYQEHPEKYQEMYGNSNLDPVEETIYQLQRIWSANMNVDPLKLRDTKQNIKYIVENTKLQRYKLTIETIPCYHIFREEDPIYLAWLNALLVVQNIPIEHLIEMENTTFDLLDVEEYCEEEGILENLQNEVYSDDIRNHPEYHDLFEKAKLVKNIQIMTNDYIENTNADTLKRLISNHVSPTYYPRFFRKYMQYLDDEEIIDILSLLNVPTETLKSYIQKAKTNITKDLNKIVDNNYDLNNTFNPNTEIVKLANQIPENIKFEKLLSHLETRIIQMLIQILSDQKFSNEDSIIFEQAISLVLDKIYLYLFKECQKVEAISVADIFELNI